MSASMPPSTTTLRSLRIIVPATTTLLGIMSFSGSLYTYCSPSPEMTKMFGITLPPTLLTSSPSEASARQKAYIRVHGIRNAVSGATLLAVTSFWRFSSTSQAAPVAAVAIQKVMAITLGLGAFVAAGDGLLLKKYLEEGRDDLSEEAKDLAEEKSIGHLVTSIPLLLLAAGWWYI